MVIKELSAKLIDDWFDFFDERAFADHEEWKGCYCTAFYSPRPAEYAATTRKKRDFARWLIENESMKGYLAYEYGKIIGWVNTNDKRKFPRLGDLCVEDERVLSIVCFIVQKEHRRRGVAQKLLARIIKDAKARGYTSIEAYPKKKAASEYGVWNGPYEMYEKNGFSDHKIQRSSVVRRVLS